VKGELKRPSPGITNLDSSLTWPVVIAGCEVGGKWRETVPRIFDDFRCDIHREYCPTDSFVLNSAAGKIAASILTQQSK